jgi:hypothetical protein
VSLAFTFLRVLLTRSVCTALSRAVTVLKSITFAQQKKSLIVKRLRWTNMYYNFCNVHQTLRATPAMGAGLSDHVWSIEEAIGLLEVTRAKQMG